MPWNLSDDMPRKCYHPDLADLAPPNNWFPCFVVVSPDKTVAVVFNIGYMLDAAVSGVPGSGHAYTPYNEVTLSFDKAANEWVMVQPEIDFDDEGELIDNGKSRTFRFALPDASLKKLFADNSELLPTYEMMQDKAKYSFPR